jgi:NitT/TauT family transport system ATP-binding protein
MNTVLEVKNLKKEFTEGNKKTLAIENFSFKIGQGEFVSIVGSSGCGKTTLLRIIAGLLEVSGGSFSKKGKTTLVFQDYSKSLFPWKTVRDNIMFGLERNHKASDATLDTYLKTVELQGFENHYPYELSGGMQQRVASARALAYNPDIILMDEPFGSLDALTKARLEDELLRVWEKFKKTIIFITHDIDEAIYLSDRVIVLSKRPAKVIDDIKINLKRPRNQLLSRESREFIDRRHAIYKFLQI